MTTIPGLPPPLRSVPEYAPDWRAWRDKVILYRIEMRRRAERDQGARDLLVEAAAEDPAFDMLMFGAAFEPRDRLDRPKGWYPMIPFGFQVRLVRFIQEVESIIPGHPLYALGRNDAIVEKARDMAGTVTFCAVAAHHWKYEDGFVCNFMSYNADQLEKANDPTTIFHKLESYLGLDERTPEFRGIPVLGQVEQVPIRSPKWLIPEGYLPKLHNVDFSLGHPTKTNVLLGVTTTERAGTGKRVTWWVTDEASKFPAFRPAWDNTEPVTDHRFALSTPDLRYGPGFRNLAVAAEMACKHERPGPSFLRLEMQEHPFVDEIMEDAKRARFAGVAGGDGAFEREYGMDYEAGSGLLIYPEAKAIEVKELTFDPSYEHLDFSIDPGTRDFCAFHIWKYNPHLDRYGLMLSYVNKAKAPDFYASLVLAKPLGQHYEYGEEEERVMDFFEDYGRRVRGWWGDPAGGNKVTGRNGKLTSFYDDFRAETAALSDGKRPIIIRYSHKPEYKRTPFRHKALRWLLRRLDVNMAQDTELTLQAIQEHHYKFVPEHREVVTMPAEPVRFWGSDRVTSAEYYAASRQMEQVIETMGIAPSLVVKRDGTAKPRRLRHTGVWEG